MTSRYYTGVMYQSDAGSAGLAPVELVHSFIERYAATRGVRPDAVLVHARGECEWPAEIGGVRIIPNPTIPYPTWAILVHENLKMEEHHGFTSG